MITENLKISIVVVCFQEKENIIECLDSIFGQSYPIEDFEVIVVDNGSTDGTQKKVDVFCKKYANCKMVINEKIGIAGSRNRGVDSSKYGHIAFTDADCVVPNDWLCVLADGMKKYIRQNKKVVAVGGSNIPPPNKSRHYDALGIMLNSYLGSRGSVQGMVFDDDRKVDHLPCVNVLFDKNAIIDIGKFDEKLGNIGEDQDLTIRLSKKGFEFYYLHNSYVWHKLRNSIYEWGKNMCLYGYGRVILLKKHPKTINIFFIIFPLFLIFLGVSFLVHIGAFLFLLIAYATVIFGASFFSVIKKRKISLLLRVAVLYFVTHFCYAFGQIKGLILLCIKKRKEYQF